MKINSDQIFTALLLNASQLAAGFFTIVHYHLELQPKATAASPLDQLPKVHLLLELALCTCWTHVENAIRSV